MADRKADSDSDDNGSTPNSSPAQSSLDQAAEMLFLASGRLFDFIEHAEELPPRQQDDELRRLPFSLPPREAHLSLEHFRVLHNLVELASRAIQGDESSAFWQTATDFVRKCDKSEPLGPFPLKRLENPVQGGGTEHELYRKLVAEVSAYKEQQKTRDKVAFMLGDLLKRACKGRSCLGLSDYMALEWMPCKQISSKNYKLARSEPFNEDVEKTVSAALRLFGYSAQDVNRFSSSGRQ